MEARFLWMLTISRGQQIHMCIRIAINNKNSALISGISIGLYGLGLGQGMNGLN